MKKNICILIPIILAVMIIGCGNKAAEANMDINEETKTAVEEDVEEEPVTEEINESNIQEETEDDAETPWLPFDYEETLYQEDGNVFGGFNVPNVVSEFNIEKADGNGYTITMDSFGVDSYTNEPEHIYIFYYLDGTVFENNRKAWEDNKVFAKNEYNDYTENEVEYRKFTNHEGSITTELGDFDYFTSKIVQTKNLSLVEDKNYPYSEEAFLEYNGGIIRIFKTVNNYMDDPLSKGSIKEFLPIIVNDISYKSKKEGEDGETTKQVASAEPTDEEQNSIEKNKEESVQEVKEKQVEKVEEVKKEEKPLTNDGVKHTYIYNETSYAINGIPMPTTVSITTTGSTPTVGSTISLTGLNESVAFAEVDAKGNRPDAPTIQAKSKTYTIKKPGTVKLIIWLEPWDDDWGGGMEEVLEWKSDGTLSATYSPGNFAQLN